MDSSVVNASAIEAWFEDYLRNPSPRVGLGRKPAVIIVDMITAFTDPSGPLYMCPPDVISAANNVIEWAVSTQAPVYFSTTAYTPDLASAGVWKDKAPAVLSHLIEGTVWVEPDPRLRLDTPHEIVTKKYSSVFFGTDLSSRLVARGVDSVVLCGIKTSTCVRASAVDALSHGFRTLVVEEAVADNTEFAHKSSLIDIDARYGDVISVSALP